VLTTSAIALDSTQYAFPRVSSSDKQERRRNTAISSLSPTTLRISHQPRTAANRVQRSLAAIDQQLTRLDSSSNPVSVTNGSVAFQSNIPSDMTLAEYRAMCVLLIGFLSENDMANVDAQFNGEV
jgi:hypothetical protein